MRFLSNIDLTKRELQNAKVHNVAVLPTPTTGGDYGLLQFRTSDNTLNIWNGTAWQQVTTAGSIANASPTTLGLVQLTGDIGGTATAVTVTGISQLVTGSAGTPSIRFASDQDTGLFSGGANILNLVTGGATRLQLSDTALNVQSLRVTGLVDPTGAQDAATKNYVDSVAQGLDTKGSVRVATTAALPANTYSIGAGTLTASANGAFPAIDGVTVNTGDRLLVKNEGNAAYNGLYTLTVAGAAGAAWVLTRTTDMDAWSEVPNAYVWVEEGTANGDTGWVSTANAGGTFGTNSIPWAKFASQAAARIDYYSNVFTTGAGTTLSIPQSTHGLRASRGIVVQVQDDSTGEIIFPDISVATSGDVTVTFAVTQGTTSWRVTLAG